MMIVKQIKQKSVSNDENGNKKYMNKIKTCIYIKCLKIKVYKKIKVQKRLKI